jgi:hypothetical protein
MARHNAIIPVEAPSPGFVSIWKRLGASAPAYARQTATHPKLPASRTEHLTGPLGTWVKHRRVGHASIDFQSETPSFNSISRWNQTVFSWNVGETPDESFGRSRIRICFKLETNETPP